jgi:hypothetical protein
MAKVCVSTASMASERIHANVRLFQQQHTS